MTDKPAPVPDNFLVLDFADGEYVFRLGVGQLGELQTKCDAGVGAIFARLMAGRYRQENGDIVLNPVEARFKYEDIVETIRLSLIGGGSGTVNGQQVKVDPVKALQLVRNYVHPRPLLEVWKIASAIIFAFVVGYADPAKAEKKSPPRAKRKPTKGGSTSA